MANEVTLPWPPKDLSPNARLHWAQKAKAVKMYRSACYLLAKKAKLSFDGDGPIPIRVVFWPPDNRRRDRDNMIAACKSLFDGVADAMGVDDCRFVPTFVVSDVTGACVKVMVG